MTFSPLANNVTLPVGPVGPQANLAAALTAALAPISLEVLHYDAPMVMVNYIASALRDVDRAVAKGKECHICLCSCSEGPDLPVQLPCKEHFFHRKCIEQALKSSSRCPVCRKHVGEPQGKSPSGRMKIEPTSQLCASYESVSTGSIKITYDLAGGVQRDYHASPGVSYAGTNRVAYLPHIRASMKLLKRLKYAWRRGLTFSVGTSLTTGQCNRIVWASIHHKTSLHGGVSKHGFPDPGYFLNCNDELDALGVPPDVDLPA